ncbi:calcium-binding protein [Marinicaulis aureus]|uniref:Calcium-binding protein n=1 Tax=Hyphococcus aureus TaxID=2666033 RepID=A0ABW1KYM5_9PROT
MPIQFSDDTRNVDGVQTLLDRVNGIGITDLAGIIGFNRVPPDHNGAVGQDHVISVLNHVMQIYDKSGNLLSTQTLESLFGVIGGNSLLPVDPNIVYDPYSERFVYVSFEVGGIDGGTINAGNDQIRLNVAVSKTSDPTDGWFVQSINANTVIGGRNTWSDYPGVAVDGDAIYITANMFQFDGGQSFAGNRLWIIDKGDGSGGLYDGGGLSFTKHNPIAAAGSGAVEATLIPVRYANDSLGGPGVFLASASGVSNGASEIIQVFHVTDPLGSPDFSVQQISLGDISNENLSSLPGATQPGTAQRVGVGDARINSGGAVWFEGKIYLTFSVAPKTGPDAGQTTTHWVELDATAPAAISLRTQGNIGGEDIGVGVHTYHSSVNVNKDGSVLINFSASGPTVYPGAYYAFRGADDPAGAFGPVQTLARGVDYYFRNRFGEGISSQTTNRWGDFSGVGVDPVDGTTFWLFNQYADQRGSPNSAGQDGRWRVVLGEARPTIQNFQFDANSPNERFFGGLGNDVLQLNALDVNMRLDISQNNNGSLRAAFSEGASGVATAYFVEAVLFQGGSGDDTLMINGAFNPSQLTNVPFVADGGAGADFFSANGLSSGLKVKFFGGDGADTLTGGGSADVIFGNNGDDLIDGGTGNDDLRGSAGNDTILGDKGRDIIRGNSGDDDIRGGSGGDTLDGGLDNDEIRGASGDDAMKGGAGDDYFSAGTDDDLVKGNEGADTLIGGDGNDSLQGNPGDDLLYGQAGDDDIRGGNDNDTLDGGAGNDTLRGNSGDDVFVYAPGADDDLIIGFEGAAGVGDVIDLSVYDGIFDDFADVQAAASEVGASTVIDLGGGDSITLHNVALADLDSDDFLF